MNIDVKQINAALRTFLTKIQKYMVFIFIITILLIYVFLVVRIGVLSQAEPDETAVAEKANTIKRLKLDQNSISKIEQLKDQNIGVQSLFENARDNPFQD